MLQMKLNDLRKRARKGDFVDLPRPEVKNAPSKRSPEKPVFRPKCHSCGSKTVSIIGRDRDILTNMTILFMKCGDCAAETALSLSDEALVQAVEDPNEDKVRFT